MYIQTIGQKWISVKTWFYKQVVLREYELPQFSDNTDYKNERIPSPSLDFDYMFPSEKRNYAYVWHASTTAELCGAIMAFSRLHDLRKTSPNAMKTNKTNEVHFVLNYKAKQLADDHDGYIEELDERKYELLEIWTALGGSLAGQSNPLKGTSNKRYLHSRLMQ